MTFIKKIHDTIQHHQRLKKVREIKKKIKRSFKRITRKETLTKISIILVGLAMLATTILPYILR